MKYKIQHGGIVRYVDEANLNYYLEKGYVLVRAIAPPAPAPVQTKVEDVPPRPEIVLEKENELMFGDLYLTQITTRPELFKLFTHLGIPFSKYDATKRLLQKRDAYIASVKEARKNEKR